MNDATILPSSEIKHKSSINVAFLQLAPGVRAASTFDHALVEPPKSQFVLGLGLFNDQHNRHYVHKVIAINKEFGIYLGPYHLDTLFPPVFTTEAVDKVAYCYFGYF